MLNKKGLDLGPSLPNHGEYLQQILTLTVSINSPNFMIKWLAIQKIYSNMFFTSCTNTRYSVSAFEDLKTKLISQEWKTIPPQN